jgi:hypothetical protein
MGDPMSSTDPIANSALLLSRLNRWRMAFFGLVILLAGVLIGIGAALIWEGERLADGRETVRTGPRRPESRPEPGARLMSSLREFLSLSDQQVQAISPVVKEHMANLQRIRQDVRPKVAEELREMDKQIASVLNPDQKRLWVRRFGRLQDQLQWQVPAGRGRPGGQGGAPPSQRGPGAPPMAPPAGQ